MEKFGKYRGIVINNNDPLQSGRIMVRVPDVSGFHESWAMPCLPCTGKGFIYSAIPDIGAGVWVEYEGGNPSFPVWSGCYLTDGQIIRKEDEANAASGFRITETSAGLMITYNGKEEAVSLNDNNGNMILSIDPGQKEIMLSADYKVVAAGQQAELAEHSILAEVSGDNLLNYLARLAATYNSHVHPGGPATPPVPAATPPASPGSHTWPRHEVPLLTESMKNSLKDFVYKAQRHKKSRLIEHAQGQSEGRSMAALFIGPSGTGRTMAAEYITAELSHNLYRIDLSSVVSKYIGETEKNLERILSKAVDKDVVLFFDEADALFGKRTEVKDSHDRYADAGISYLLQALESHNGIVLFACSKKQNIDPAFIRRMQFVLEFPQ
jgi:hypothetical protein